MRTLITGASGFIGEHLLLSLKNSRHTCCAIINKPGIKLRCADEYVCADLSNPANLGKLPTSFGAIVHLADGLSVFEKITGPIDTRKISKRVNSTLYLAQWAIENNIRHFIYVSSVKAMCNESGEVVTEDSKIQPNSAFGHAKRHAEEQLTELLSYTNVRLVILRPPALHGPGSKGNIRQLLSWADTPWPIPLKKIDSHQSTISVRNLCDAIKTALDKPHAPGGEYLLADNDALSLSEMIGVLRQALGRKNRIFNIPGWLWSLLQITPGFQISRQLSSQLVISNHKFCENFNWSPMTTTQESLQLMARSYTQNKHIIGERVKVS